MRRHPRPATRSTAALTIVALVPCSCTLSAPAVDSVLRTAAADSRPTSAASPASWQQRAAEAIAAQDAECARSLALARAPGADAVALVRASQWLFQAAELRMQCATLAALERTPARTWKEVDAADERIASADRDEILGLCTAGKDLAERALVLAPEDPGALLYSALHLSLVAWANGPARSLLAGYGKKLERAIAAVVAKAPEFDHGAPLRLQGRFLAEAPWPYGDATKARSTLVAACKLGPAPVTHLFLGDALADAGDLEGARREWTAATSAEDVPSTASSGPFHRELARLRLATFAEQSR